MRCLVWKAGRFFQDTIKRVISADIELEVIEEKQNLLDKEHIDYLLLGDRNDENKPEIAEILKELEMDAGRVIPCTYLYYLHKKYTKFSYLDTFKRKMEEHTGIVILNNWTETNGNWSLIIKAFCLWKEVKICFLNFNESLISIRNLSDGNVMYSAMSVEGGLTFNCRKSVILEIRSEGADMPYMWIETSETRMSHEYMDIISKKNIITEQFRDIMEKQTSITAFHEEDYYFLNNFVDLQGTILDVGGNYGQSIYSFMESTKQMKVLSIEANPDLWDILEFYCELYPTRVSIIKSGVSDKEGTLTFYRCTNGGGIPSGSFLREDLVERLGESDVEEISLDVQRIDSLVNSDDIWFCKLDIEGLELEALKGMTNILNNSPIFCIEQNWRNYEGVLNYMKEYECYYYDWNKNIFTKNNVCNSINYWLIPKKGTKIAEVNELMKRMNVIFE